MKKIYFITTNSLKVKIANAILKKYGIKVIQKNIELPEIQSFNGQEICEYAARYAREIFNKPVITTDVSYSISALNGFPGPFVKFINKWLSAEDILKMMKGKKDRSMIITEYLSYCDENKNLVTFKVDIPCKITKKILDNNKGTTFDKITIREGTNVPQNILDKKTLKLLFTKQMKIWEDFGKFFSTKSENFNLTTTKNKEKFYPLEIPFSKITKKSKSGNESRGILVAIEGIDGSGKTTLVQNIFKELIKRKIKCSILKTFAGNTNFHSVLMKIKDLMASNKKPLPGEIDQTIYTIEFLTYVTTLLPRLLTENEVVLADGYILRRLALARSITKKINSIPEFIISKFIENNWLPYPDITFYLNISVQEAWKRVLQREGINFNQHKKYKFFNRSLSILKVEEKERPENLKEIKSEFKSLLRNFEKSQRIIILDALQTPRYLTKKCIKEILQLIKINKSATNKKSS